MPGPMRTRKNSNHQQRAPPARLLRVISSRRPSQRPCASDKVLAQTRPLRIDRPVQISPRLPRLGQRGCARGLAVAVDPGPPGARPPSDRDGPCGPSHQRGGVGGGGGCGPAVPVAGDDGTRHGYVAACSRGLCARNVEAPRRRWAPHWQPLHATGSRGGRGSDAPVLGRRLVKRGRRPPPPRPRSTPDVRLPP